jgi:hypothetical protein
MLLNCELEGVRDTRPWPVSRHCVGFRLENEENREETNPNYPEYDLEALQPEYTNYSLKTHGIYYKSYPDNAVQGENLFLFSRQKK